LNVSQARAFLRALGAKGIVQTGKWLMCSCPLAPVYHQHHKDSSPSFGLTCEPDRPSRYNCFACGHGSALELIHELEHNDLPADTGLARKILEAEQLEVVPLPEYGEFSVPEDQWLFRPWPELWLTQFQPVMGVPMARDYLFGRGVVLEQMIAQDLRWDVSRMMVVFPIREAHGLLAGARGRSVLKDVAGKDKHYDYSHDGIPKNIRGVWYNEQALLLDGPVVVVEGQFDCLRVLQVWPKTVANLTALPTAEKLAKLSYSSRVLHIPDTDATGTQSVAKFQQGLLKHNVPYTPLALPDSVKDPGDCHPEYLNNLIRSVLGL
jgi:DNA primase